MTHAATGEAQVHTARVRLAAHLALHRLLTQLRNDPSDGGKLIDETLRLVCDVARRRGLRAEQLLVIMKEAWRDLPERHAMHGDIEVVTLSQIISACIREFYRDDGQGSAS